MKSGLLVPVLLALSFAALVAVGVITVLLPELEDRPETTPTRPGAPSAAPMSTP